MAAETKRPNPTGGSEAGMRARWKQRVAALKTETYALSLAARDPRVPWYAKALAATVAAYLLSPIDLIPDVIPVLGALDDLILVPLGLWLALRMIPDPVLETCRMQARKDLAGNGPVVSRAAGAVVVALWVLAILGSAWMIWG